MIFFSFVLFKGVVNSISQACGKLSFHIGNYLLPNQKETFPYHNLRHLSRSFKDNLANRLLCKLLEGLNTNTTNSFIVFFCFASLESGQKSTATLIGLPNEIKVKIFSLKTIVLMNFQRFFSFVWRNIYRLNRFWLYKQHVETFITR